MVGWRWALVSPDVVAPSRMVGVPASVNLPLHHEVQEFSSGTTESVQLSAAAATLTDHCLYTSSRLHLLSRNISGKSRAPHYHALTTNQPRAERVQALADISHSALCCHSHETQAPIANVPNSAQLEGTPTIPPSYPCPCSSVGMRRGTHRQTHTDTQTSVTNRHFASAMPHSKCNEMTMSVTLSHCFNATSTDILIIISPV